MNGKIAAILILAVLMINSYQMQTQMKISQ